jgi:hypothetical protein
MDRNILYRGHMETSNPNQRKHERKAYHTAVDLTVDSLTYIVLLKDLSLGGAFIAGDHLPPVENETPVSLSIPFENKPEAVKLQGTVRRVTEGGIGIEFF